MALKAKAKNENKKEVIDHDIKVLSCREVNGSYTLNLEVNDVTIYGCWYREAKDKDGNETFFISFPCQKGKDGKYYNHAYVALSEKDMESIEEQMIAIIGE